MSRIHRLQARLHIKKVKIPVLHYAFLAHAHILAPGAKSIQSLATQTFHCPRPAIPNMERQIHDVCLHLLLIIPSLALALAAINWITRKYGLTLIKLLEHASIFAVAIAEAAILFCAATAVTVLPPVQGIPSLFSSPSRYLRIYPIKDTLVQIVGLCAVSCIGIVLTEFAAFKRLPLNALDIALIRRFLAFKKWILSSKFCADGP